MNTKEKYIESHQGHIDTYQSYIDDSDWIPDIPDDWNAHVFGCYSVRGVTISLPFNRAMYQVVKDYFSSIGWKFDHEKIDESKLDEYDWWTYIYFIPPDEDHYMFQGRYAEVRFDWSTKGSVCKRKTIGYKEVQKPIFELTCE